MLLKVDDLRTPQARVTVNKYNELFTNNKIILIIKSIKSNKLIVINIIIVNYNNIL